MFIIVDGADQSSFGLPHFVTSSKSQRGHGLKVRLIGYCRDDGVLPPRLFVQVDNCGRENKNRFFMAYMELLVATGVFQCIQVGFLPVGHTHEDIDQAFSRTSERLRSQNAVTLDDLNHELRASYRGSSAVTHLKNIANWSKLCEEQKVLTVPDAFSHFRYFSFSRSFEQPTAVEAGSHLDVGTFQTICQVKINCTDVWENLPMKGSTSHVGFLKSLPSLSRTPPTTIECPPGKVEVTKRLESEDGRINDDAKLQELYKLRDHVFRSRIELFHWDLRHCVEEKYKRLARNRPIVTSHSDEEDEDMVQDFSHLAESDTDDEGIYGNYSYELNSFVAVRAARSTRSRDPPVWVGKVMQTKKAKSNVVKSILLHWFGPTTNDKWLEGTYCPMYKKEGSSNREAA